MPTNDHEDDLKDEKNPRPLDEDDIALLKTYVSLDFTFLLNPNLSPDFNPIIRSLIGYSGHEFEKYQLDFRFCLWIFRSDVLMCAWPSSKKLGFV